VRTAASAFIAGGTPADWDSTARGSVFNRNTVVVASAVAAGYRAESHPVTYSADIAGITRNGSFAEDALLSDDIGDSRRTDCVKADVVTLNTALLTHIVVMASAPVVFTRSNKFVFFIA